MGKTTLITGASRGIGKEIAKIFAKNGYNTIINYLNSEEKAKKLLNKLLLTNPSVMAIKADVSNQIQVENMIKLAKKRFEKIDILINNAGVSLYKQIQHTNFEDYENIMNVNFKGVFNCTKSVIPEMISRKNGIIINVSSIFGKKGASCESLYSASKAAIIGFSKSIKKELKFSGIKVFYITPGFVKTDMTKNFSNKDANRIGGVKKAEEIAYEIFRLCN